MEYLDSIKESPAVNQGAKARRVILHYKMPLVSLLGDFYDKIKSVCSGFASLNYDFVGYAQNEAFGKTEKRKSQNGLNGQSGYSARSVYGDIEKMIEL